MQSIMIPSTSLLLSKRFLTAARSWNINNKAIALQLCRNSTAGTRLFSADAAAADASTKTKAKSGPGLFQRLKSFVLGAGLMALVTQYFLREELIEGNKQMLKKQKDIEKRLKALEGKK